MWRSVWRRDMQDIWTNGQSDGIQERMTMVDQVNVEKKEPAVLQVKMFGGFSMIWENRTITFTRSSNKKFIQLLQLLFLHYRDGIEKSVVLDALYEGNSAAVNNKNLNNVIYRLKKQLVQAGLPEDEPFVSLKKGLLRWKSSFSVEVDTVAFMDLAKEADLKSGEARIEALREAERAYTGELLPEFSNELWVVEENQLLASVYEALIRELGDYLEKKRELSEALRMYQKAAKLFPSNEWQLKVIDCLLALKRYPEAQRVYQETVRFYCEEMGLPPGEELLGRLRQIEEQMIQPTGSFKTIQAQVRDKESGGAYYCLFPSFIDSCRIVARMAERSGQSVFLMLLSLDENGGKNTADPERLAFQMEQLKEAIRAALRRGDLYTRYSRNQYLIILIGTEHENCQKAFQRIQDEWKKAEGRKGILTYSTESLLRVVDENFVEQKRRPSWGRSGSVWT
ncbi:MAG: hypothetical protein MR562_02770 [Clostridiaceae bacterium]|nr:hypothetical protein [Clostridiaceae bacterium]